MTSSHLIHLTRDLCFPLFLCASHANAKMWWNVCWVFLFFFIPQRNWNAQWRTSGRADMEAPLKVIQSELKGGSKMVFSITVIKIFSLMWHLNQRIGSGWGWLSSPKWPSGMNLPKKKMLGFCTFGCCITEKISVIQHDLLWLNIKIIYFQSKSIYGWSTRSESTW